MQLQHWKQHFTSHLTPTVNTVFFNYVGDLSLITFISFSKTLTNELLADRVRKVFEKLADGESHGDNHAANMTEKMMYVFDIFAD